MARMPRLPARRPRRPIPTAKPSGSIHPRVQRVGPEHFGIVAVDCAKARSKWMLTDFYGNILIEPTPVEHTRPGLDDFVARLRRATSDRDLRDLIVAIERTRLYQPPIRRAGLRSSPLPPTSTPPPSYPCPPGIPACRPPPAIRPTTPTCSPSSGPPSMASA